MDFKQAFQTWKQRVTKENGKAPEIYIKIDGLTEQQRHELMIAFLGCFNTCGDSHVSGTLEFYDDGKPVTYA